MKSQGLFGALLCLRVSPLFLVFGQDLVKFWVLELKFPGLHQTIRRNHRTFWFHRTVRGRAPDSPAAPTGLSGATGQSSVARAAAPFFLELFFPLCFASTLLFGVFTSGPYSLLADSLQDTPRCGVANEPRVC